MKVSLGEQGDSNAQRVNEWKTEVQWANRSMAKLSKESW
jgi:hypothetical protein